MSHLDKIPAVLNKRIFQKVFKIAEVSKLSKEEKAMFESNLKAKWDYENSIAFAREEAAEEAAEKAGHKKTLEIAGNLKKMGVAIEAIAQATGLSIAEIDKL